MELHIDAVTAANMRRLRLARGWGQEALAREARQRLGLDWTRDHVDAIERGKRRLSVGEVLALAHVFGVALSEFLAADSWVWLTAGLRAKGLPEICRSERFEETEDPTDRTIAPALERARAQAQPPTVAEQKAARALQKSPALVRAAAQRRWKRSLDDERERRVQELRERAAAEGGPELTRRGLQALRGHVGRELYQELRDVLQTAPAGRRTAEPAEPSEGSRKGSRERKPNRKRAK